MKKSSLLKFIVVMGLSLLLVFNLIVTVFAADDNADFGEWIEPENTVVSNNTASAGNTTETNTLETNTATDTNSTSGFSDALIDTNTSLTTENTTTVLNTSTTDTNDYDDNNSSSVNSLAYTGVEDTSIFAIVILLGAVVAGYSFKKLRDYNNL